MEVFGCMMVGHFHCSGATMIVEHYHILEPVVRFDSVLDQ